MLLTKIEQALHADHENYLRKIKELAGSVPVIVIESPARIRLRAYFHRLLVRVCANSIRVAYHGIEIRKNI